MNILKTFTFLLLALCLTHCAHYDNRVPSALQANAEGDSQEAPTPLSILENWVGGPGTYQGKTPDLHSCSVSFRLLKNDGFSIFMSPVTTYSGGDFTFHESDLKRLKVIENIIVPGAPEKTIHLEIDRSNGIGKMQDSLDLTKITESLVSVRMQHLQSGKQRQGVVQTSSECRLTRP